MRMRRLASLALALIIVAWPRAGDVRTFAEESASGMSDQSVVAEPLAIVVNRQNPIGDLSSRELRQIFLGNRTYWNDGRRITIIMREPGEPERKAILRDVCGMTEDQFKVHFLRGLYSGDILTSPKILASPWGVRKFIFNVPGAIGYLRQSELDPTVKVVRIDEQMPGDRGYKLQVP